MECRWQANGGRLEWQMVQQRGAGPFRRASGENPELMRTKSQDSDIGRICCW